MVHPNWTGENRRIIVCVDSYAAGILKGRFCSPRQETEEFCGLSQFLLRVDDLLDEQRHPQAYTEQRSFSSLLHSSPRGDSSGGFRKGAAATFDLQILFRQHSSWQGILRWREKGAEQSFRSVLELIGLMDSALRIAEGGECA